MENRVIIIALFFILCYIIIGDIMVKVAIDKKSKHVLGKYNHDFVYIFDDEPLDELIALDLPCVNHKYCEYVDINTTMYDIPCFKKANVNLKHWDSLKKKDYKIAIIIPNYNYGEWLPKCLESIANQTYKNYEVIFVDDMSTDNSVDIAYSFVDKLSNIKIVELKQKRYNGGARNEAYLYLSNDVDYVYYLDSDDWLYNDSALQHINNALQKYPDVLFVSIMACRNGNIRPAKTPEYKDKYDAIKGWSGSCGKVIKKELATKQECLYPEGTLKEDRTQHRKVCIYMNSFECLDKPIYVWNQDNRKSVTSIREKVIWGTSTIRHYADTLQLCLSVKGKDPTIDSILEDAVKLTKEEMLQGKDKQW